MELDPVKSKMGFALADHAKICPKQHHGSCPQWTEILSMLKLGPLISFESYMGRSET